MAEEGAGFGEEREASEHFSLAALYFIVAGETAHAAEAHARAADQLHSCKCPFDASHHHRVASFLYELCGPAYSNIARAHVHVMGVVDDHHEVRADNAHLAERHGSCNSVPVGMDAARLFSRDLAEAGECVSEL